MICNKKETNILLLYISVVDRGPGCTRIPVPGLAFQSRPGPGNFENGQDFGQDLEFKMKAKIHFLRCDKYMQLAKLCEFKKHKPFLFHSIISLVSFSLNKYL